MTATERLVDEALWHDVECASYDADFSLWEDLAAECHGEILDIGCGTGRVALRLAAAGHEVSAVDIHLELIEALARSASERNLRVRTTVGDARSLALGRRFALVIAPMQVVQLLGGAEGRRALLERVRDHLGAGGVFAAALADPFETAEPSSARPPLPDVLERDGWVFSSTPIAMRPEGRRTVIERLREAVSPHGEIADSVAAITLDEVSPETLEREAREVGLAVAPRRGVPPTADYVGSSVVVLVRT